MIRRIEAEAVAIQEDAVHIATHNSLPGPVVKLVMEEAIEVR